MYHFEFLTDVFSDSKVISVNLFFHGNSELIEDDLHHDNLKEVLEEVIQIEGVDRFTLIGYSLGGKFALNMINYFPEKVDRIVLIASEGIKANNFYNFSSRIILMRKLYKSAIKHPNWVFNFAKVLTKLGVMSQSYRKFIDIQMGEEKNREMAYNTWAKFRYIFPNQGRLKRNLEQHNIDLVIMIGEKDKIIKPDIGKYFIRKMGRGEFRLIPVSHDIFRPDYLEIIKAELKQIVSVD